MYPEHFYIVDPLTFSSFLYTLPFRVFWCVAETSMHDLLNPIQTPDRLVASIYICNIIAGLKL